MATIGRILVDVAARTASFEKAMTGVQRRLQSVQKMAGQFGAVLAGAGLVQFISQTGDAAEKILQLSDRLGVTTDDLQKLQYMAEQSGVGFEALAGGINKMQRAAVEAAQGGKSQAEAFDALGINVADFLKLNADQQLGRVADAFSAIQNPAQQTALAMDVFGKSGADLLPILLAGSSGIRKMGQEFTDLGAAMSRDTLEKMDQAADSIARFTMSAKNLAAAIVSTVGPALDGLSQAFSGIASVLGPVVKFLSGTVLSTIYTVGSTITGIAYEIYNVLAKLPGKFGASMGEFRNYLGELQAEYRRMADEAAAGAVGIEATGAAAKPAAKEVAGLVAALEEVEVTTKRISGARTFDAMGRDITMIHFRLQEAIKAAENFDRAIEAMPTFEVADDTETAFAAMGKSVEQVSGPIAKVHTDIGEWAGAAENAARNLQSAFAEFFFDPFKDGLRGMLRGFVDLIRKMVAEVMAAQALKALFSWMGGSGGWMGAIGGAMSGAIAGKAVGGPVSAGTPYVVGEKGPELFVPGQSGGIVPNHKLGSGKVVNITTNVDARGATTDFIKQLPAILEASNRRAVQAARAAIYDDYSRGAFGRI